MRSSRSGAHGSLRAALRQRGGESERERRGEREEGRERERSGAHVSLRVALRQWGGEGGEEGGERGGEREEWGQRERERERSGRQRENRFPGCSLRRPESQQQNLSPRRLWVRP